MSARVSLRAVCAGVALTCTASMGWAAEPPASAKPPTPSAEGQWSLGDLYASPEDWQAQFKRTAKDIDALARFKGQLTESPEMLARALDAIGEVEKTTARLAVYASLTADENLSDNSAQERQNRITQLGARLDSVTGFVTPALAEMPPETLADWATRPVLADYRYRLTRISEQAPHILGADTESALAALAPVTSSEESYSLLSNADIPWPEITVNGDLRRLDSAGYAALRKSDDRATRKQVFDTFWATWQTYATTFGALLNKEVTAHVTSARLHHYDSALDAALSGNDIPVGVYDQLVASANAHLDSLHRYLKLRKRLLGVDTLRYYDIYPPLTKRAPEFDLTQAKALTREATQPLGQAYQALLKEATDADWTSAYPARGKRSGAYMNGAAYDVHPYVLMNFNGHYSDVSTYAHEWGHGVHSMLASSHQPWASADYPIFTAEVASTVNEFLLIDHMIASAETPSLKLYYIGQALESLRATFFRQTQFAEFERAIHQSIEHGDSLSGERLNRMYGALLEKYYGVDQGVMQIDPAYHVEWAYVPHFYYNFYVYQYATSITAAYAIARELEAGNLSTREAYLDMLKRGGSDSGYRLIKATGVDLATPAPYDALMGYMNDLIDQANALLDKHPELGAQ